MAPPLEVAKLFENKEFLIDDVEELKESIKIAPPISQELLMKSEFEIVNFESDK